MSQRPASGCPGHGALCESGELFPTREAVQAPCVAEQRVKPAGEHVTGLPRARAGGSERAGEAVPLALRQRQTWPQEASLEQPAPQLS
jgi:hypothetical protein